jgi:hypothetical protein
MSGRFDEYLWDPQSASDPEIAAFERILAPASARKRGLADQAPPRTRQRLLRRLLWAASIGLLGAALCYGYWFYRLDWREGGSWAQVTQDDDTAIASQWRVGETLVTRAGQVSTIDVARIGSLTLSENSALQLVQTRKGRHRVRLAYGHLHAKVWAPPAYFGVESGSANIIDMGCEFDLKIDRSRHGSLSVTSGWVIYRDGGIEIAVPAGYSVTFTEEAAQLPFRHEVSNELGDRIAELESFLRNPDAAAVDQAALDIAKLATDADYYTLLQLLIRYPSLAEGPLYSRLAAALRASESAQHRQRWAAGDTSARNEWWSKLPTQPKTWWVNWRDAF